jgi:hypothetical protein
MLYTIESTFGGFGDVLVEIFALPKACLWGQCFASPANGDSVLLITVSAAKTVAILANSFATLMGDVLVTVWYLLYIHCMAEH